MDKIKVVGARIHNLKDINVNIPKKKIILIPIASMLIFGFSITNVDAIQNPLELFMPSSEKPIIPDTSAMSPKAQMLAGISASQVMCKEGLNLVFKATDGSPICIKASTVYKLIETGWISMESAFAQEAELETEQVSSEPKTITTQLDFLPNENERAMYFTVRISEGLIKYTEVVKSNFFKFTPFKKPVESNPQITPENTLPRKTPFRFLLETLPSKENINYYQAIDDYFQIDSPLFKSFDVSIDVVSGDGTVLQTWEYRNCDLEDYVVYLQDNIIFNRFHGGDGPEIRERSIFHCGGISIVAPENED